jgi:hypothetical protein
MTNVRGLGLAQGDSRVLSRILRMSSPRPAHVGFTHPKARDEDYHEHNLI